MNEYVTSIVRHTLTSVGGSLVTKGLITATAFDEVVGSVIVIAGVVWSVASKWILSKLHSEQIMTALNTPVPTATTDSGDVKQK